MKLSSLSRAAVCLAGGLVRLGLGARLPHSSLMQIVEDVDGGMELGHIDQPQYTLFLDEEDMHMEQRYEGLHKRGYYTCYNRQTTSVTVPDCQAIIDRISAAGAPSFTVPSGLCLTWWQGTCMSRLCAKTGAPPSSAARGGGLNKTAASMLGELEDVILDDCVRGGQDGMSGDCANLDANCGSYRLTLEHHGSEVLGGPAPAPVPVSSSLSAPSSAAEPPAPRGLGPKGPAHQPPPVVLE
ncbi:hypothetical protein LQW54_002432 [Pestalotiopsis sp. IQ-011]